MENKGKQIMGAASSSTDRTYQAAYVIAYDQLVNVVTASPLSQPDFRNLLAHMEAGFTGKSRALVRLPDVHLYTVKSQLSISPGPGEVGA